MYKVITISGDDDPTGRLFARVVSSDTPLEKTASAELHPDIQKFISGVKPTSGKVYILVNALGAGEYYGSNLNGDFFEEAELNPTDPKADWGYKTFLKAGCYRNHSNKDPGKTLGKVVVAVYNSKMHRVELIIEFDEKLCEQQGHGDLFTKLKNGEKPSVSMGARVAFDKCCVCGHVSRTTQDHCDHFKTQAGQIMPDGKKVFVYNPKPRFFDISVVVIGADRISHVMHKIASLNGSQNIIGDTAHDRLAALVKRAAQSKRAEIKKEIPATSAQVVGRIASKEDDLPNSLLDRLGKHHDLGAALSAVTSAGMVLKPREFQRIIIIKIGQHPLADQLDSLGGIFPPSSLLDDSIDMPCCPTVSGPGGIGYLLKALLPSIGERSCFNQPLSGRVTIIKTASAVQPRQYVDTPLLRKISAAYNSYRDQVVEKIASIVGNVTARDIDLLSAVRSRMLEDAFLSRSSITKSASVTDTSALLSPASLAYLYSAHRDTGEQTKTAAALLRNHPLVALSMQRGVNKLDVPTFTTK